METASGKQRAALRVFVSINWSWISVDVALSRDEDVARIKKFQKQT